MVRRVRWASRTENDQNVRVAAHTLRKSVFLVEMSSSDIKRRLAGCGGPPGAAVLGYGQGTGAESSRVEWSRVRLLYPVPDPLQAAKVAGEVSPASAWGEDEARGGKGKVEALDAST